MRDDERGADESHDEEIPTGFGVNAGIVAEIRQRWDLDPHSVHESWSEVFEGEERPLSEAKPEPAAKPLSGALASPQLAEKYARVLRLIHAYRARGHRIADTDPLGARSEYFPELDPAVARLAFSSAPSARLAVDLTVPCLIASVCAISASDRFDQ